jgi:23S rRNA (uracil1939-C5)-methyltransferase
MLRGGGLDPQVAGRLGRVTVPAVIDCIHAARCPGCALIALPLAAQLAAKAERVARALAAYPALGALRPEPVRAADTVVDYRTRAKLAVAPGPRIGLFARGSHEVLDLPGCRVLAPAIAASVAALRRLLAAPPPGSEPVLRAAGDGSGRLRAVDLREVRDEYGAGVMLTLVLRAPSPSQRALDAGCDALQAEIPSLAAIAVSLHDGRSPQLLGAAPRGLRGAPLHRDVVRPGVPWSLAAPGGFAQVHRAQAAALHAEIERALGKLEGLRALDVYAGSGALGLALAAAGAKVTLVESFAPAAQAAARAAREQDLAARIDAHTASAEDEVPRLAATGARFDIAIANPPRRGVAPRVREALAVLCSGSLVYVSCEPATLARDLAHLAQLGWIAERVVPFDLMPQTAEVECVALLRRGAIPELELLYEDEEIFAVGKPPFLATIPHAERAGSLQKRVRARRGAEQAVALHHLDADTSGVCLFAKRAEFATGWRRALADARTAIHYVALVRGVAREKARIASPLREAGRSLAAVTRYRRVEVLAGHALLDVTPETRRTHQIRRHLAAIGAAVLGDDRYGHAASNRHLFERHFLDRPFLHCASIELLHPDSGATLRIAAPLAPDLSAVAERLRAVEPKS